ncbi:uncharacterized protein LOC130562199 isoform X2 [Triplophysa rosa]|uniref:uncharacterized protein LOC130562199 isoform X2 n=1 Tax=Triplophysa rosa TaxID=992332 RepID=UPI002545C497|nr:uncharacterized protein LOC130562199 isoform X2 [Triplophysa rosa]
MRRKTIAKRILYTGHEGCGEQAEEASHIFCHEMKRRRWRAMNAEISSYDVDYVKFKTRVLGSLQSRSRAELITTVLSMQREMDGLREQIRSLTACGKLAQTLEGLIERSDRWLSSTSETPTPSIPRALERSHPPCQISPPTAISGKTSECANSDRQGCGQYEVKQTMPQRNGKLCEQKRITADLLERCNTGTTAQKLTNDLLRCLYDRDCLASHSISGVINSKRGIPKPALPSHEIHAILRTVQRFFPGKTDSEIKGYIRQKLQNEAKRFRKRPHPSEDPLVGSFEETEAHRAEALEGRRLFKQINPALTSCSTPPTLLWKNISQHMAQRTAWELHMIGVQKNSGVTPGTISSPIQPSYRPCLYFHSLDMLTANRCASFVSAASDVLIVLLRESL